MPATVFYFRKIAILASIKMLKGRFSAWACSDITNLDKLNPPGERND